MKDIDLDEEAQLADSHLKVENFWQFVNQLKDTRQLSKGEKEILDEAMLVIESQYTSIANLERLFYRLSGGINQIVSQSSELRSQNKAQRKLRKIANKDKNEIQGKYLVERDKNIKNRKIRVEAGEHSTYKKHEKIIINKFEEYFNSSPRNPIKKTALAANIGEAIYGENSHQPSKSTVNNWLMRYKKSGFTEIFKVDN